jgi:predicted DsbA family dithiol-disulfide isomerase
MSALHVVVYSDFLCPWCFNAFTKLESVRGELEQKWREALEFEWRAFLLRPVAKAKRDPEKFRAYTESWRRVAEDEPRAPFRVWSGDAPPPTHSVPPHLVAKAASAVGADAGARMRERLFRAYFAENRDISSENTLRTLWGELELPPTAFELRLDPALERSVFEEHQEAVDCGATGVPALRLAEQEFVLMGAQPQALYTRWFERARAAQNA